ncbi:MAG: tetratricopeptide repeat protein [Phycisphaeraceae bacterium]
MLRLPFHVPACARGIAFAAVIAVTVLACQQSPHDVETTNNYRTIRAEPLRNTDAARRAHEQGLEHLDQQNLELAQQAFERALTADVEYGPAHNSLGKVFYQQQDWYRAAWEFEYAKKLMPRRAEPRNNLALVLEQAGEFDRAIDLYREAVGLAPDNIRYRANLARALIRRGDRSREVRVLLEAILEQDTRPQWLTWASRQLESKGWRFE